MNSYDNSTVAKNLLLQLESYVKALSQRGPTDLTVYLENFATKLMEAYYGYSFVNMNYISKNIAGIDLLNKEENHGIQFTIENNNSRKVIDSIKNAKSYNKVTVFFFDHNSVKTIVNNIQKKGEWKDNLEVISLFDIFDMIETDAEKASKFREICNLWIDGNTTIYSDLTNKLNNETKKRIESNIRSKKYIPEIYIPENKLKKECRFFADPSWATEFFLRKTPTYFKGFCYEQIKKCNVKLKDGTNISFERDCDVSGFYKEIYPELYMDDILGKLKNYMIMTESVRNGVEFYNEKGHQLTINETSATLENGIYFTISNDIKLYEYSKKKFFFIVKDAGQGKTNFLCDFSKNILLKRKTPSIYINVNELTKNLLATIKEQISLSVGKTYEDSFNLLQQYCYSINKSLIICIDGLNEKNNLSEFKNEVLELFRFADRYNFIKIIATSRNKAYQTYFKDFKTESFGDLIVENIEEFRGHYGRKSDEFKRKIFEKYRNYFNVSCYISSVAKNNLVNDTLLLRIFCEVYENNTEAIINDIFLYELFHFYIKKRSTQLLKAGKLKRDEDLISLLLKISQKMIFTHNLNDFSYDGFTSEEKDLLDIIVQEDIIIKSSDENGIALFGEKTSFSFTYDEFRDFLLASVILSLEDTDFKKELESISLDADRYDGVLKFLFVFCKTKGDKKISLLEPLDVYKKIYSENIFSIEDKYLDKHDVLRIKNALKELNKWAYSNVVKRLDVDKYVNLSVIDIVEVYIDNFIGNPLWEQVFLDTAYPQWEERGIIPELLESKIYDTRPEEIYGILLLLSTMSLYGSKIKNKYLTWLRTEYAEIYSDTLNYIMNQYSCLSYRASAMLYI